MKIRRIFVKGFKSIAEQGIDLGRVNCFIGANGVGKSNVLEALGILGAAAGGQVDDEAIIRRGVRAGLPRLFKTSFKKTRILPNIRLEAYGEPEARFVVSLLNPLDRPEPAWSYKTEYLSSGENEIVRRGVRGAGSDSGSLHPHKGLSALKIIERHMDDSAVRLIQKLQDYVIYTPNTPGLRATIPDQQPRAPLGLIGGGLAEAFDALSREVGEETLDEVLELVDWVSTVSITPSAGGLLSPSVARSRNVLKFTDRFMALSRNTLTAADASEGALYVLFAAVLCLSRASPSILAIDNLDSALNPRLVTRLVSRLSGWLMRADPDRQLLFTAHNPAALDGLDLENDEVRLVAVDRNSLGHTTFRRIELTPQLRDQNREYPLSRLWAMGYLGAVPNV